jgi:hypothetical protein
MLLAKQTSKTMVVPHALANERMPNASKRRDGTVTAESLNFESSGQEWKFADFNDDDNYAGRARVTSSNHILERTCIGYITT